MTIIGGFLDSVYQTKFAIAQYIIVESLLYKDTC